MRRSSNLSKRSLRFLVAVALLAGNSYGGPADESAPGFTKLVPGNIRAQLTPAITGIPTTITLASSPNPSTYGALVTLTAAVSPATVGNVTFYDGFTVLGISAVTGGQAILTTSLLNAGPHSLKAYFSGNTSYAVSTSTAVVQTVNSVPGFGFQAPVNYAAGTTANYVVTGDFNGDGRADLAVTNYGSGNVSILIGNADGTFQPARNYSTGSEPISLATGDFNGDGKTDLVVANEAFGQPNGSVTILLGVGDGTFRAGATIADANGPVFVAVGDFNGDGKADLAVANLTTANASVFLGNGDGTFQAAVNYAAGTDPYSIAIGDFNGDGKADLVVFDLDFKNLVVLFGAGDGTFQAGPTFLAGSQMLSVAVADFNGDGKADIAAGNGNGLTVLLGNGDGTFRANTTFLGGPISSLALGDFNGDGKPDLVVTYFYTGNLSSTVAVLMGNGDGTFQAALIYPNGNYALVAGEVPTVVVGDFNGDGRADLAVADQVVKVLLAAGPSTTTLTSSLNPSGYGQSVTFSATVTSTTGTAPKSGSVTFFNGAAILGSATLSGGQASLTTGSLPAGTNSITARFSGDNTDGASTSAPVVQTVTGSSSTILTSSANPATFGQKITLTVTVAPASSTGSVRFYDGGILLGQGTLSSGVASLSTELLAAGTHSMTAYYNGDINHPVSVSAPLAQTIVTTPVSGFATAVNYATGGPPAAMLIADFNGDGKEDVATANEPNVSVQLGNGDGTLRTAVSYPFSDRPIAIAAGDFNKDGKTDLAVLLGTGNVTLLLGNGDGTFQSAGNFAVVTTPTAMAVGDFDGDGNLDVVVTGQGGAFSILLGNGSGGFAGGGTYSSRLLSASAVAVADFDGDGRLDLVMTSKTPLPCSSNCFPQNYLAVFLGNGDGTFRPLLANSQPGCSLVCNSYPSAFPVSVVVGDFNGDGRPDVAVADQSYGLVIFLGNGDGTVSLPVRYGQMNLNYSSVAIGDFNADGKADLVVAQQNGNNVPLFLGNGDGTFQTPSAFPTGLPPISIAIGDFNGDGRPDIVTANSGGNNVSILLGTTIAPPTVFIDSPAPGASVSGTVNVSGWAINNTTSVGSAISGVVVKVDGAVVGTATYGSTRPDVCAAFPGRAGCPNVGYSFLLNTNGLSTGAHTLTVSATNSDAIPVTGSASITINTSNVPPLVVIDSPMPNSTLSGTATVSGWAIDNGVSVGTAIASVQVSVDGTVVGNATYGSSRGDVCAAFPGRIGCPNVGFTFALNTTSLAAGTHVITVSATDSDGNPDIGTRSVTVTVASVVPNVFIETPTAGAVVSGVTTVTGWAVDNATAISNVVIKVDGVVLGTASYGINRPDICTTFPGRPGCPNVGFTFAVDSTKLTAGVHTLTAVATDSDGTPDSGSWSTPFVVTAPPTVFIDSLAPGGLVSGTITVSGWAIDPATAIGNVQIKVDGNVVANATYGTARADVCVVFPGRTGCPNVGFTYQLNTTPLAPGTHTITAVATDTDLSPLSSSYSVTVTVPASATLPTVYMDSIASGATVSGIVTVSGWAVDPSSFIGNVVVKVDGTTMGTATYGTQRSDVCDAYPGRRGCPRVGFFFQLDTATLSPGAHTLSVTATDTDPIPLSSTFSIPIIVLSTATAPMVVIDSLASGATVSGTVTVSGWAIDTTTPITLVQVQVDGSAVGTASYGLARPDVCAVYPGRQNCPNVGYTFQLNTATLAAGNHTITAVATDADSIPLSGSFSVTVKK